MPASTSISIETPELVATPVAHLVPRKTGAPEDDGYDPSDLSWINKLAAIGDSYSSGIGAGDRLGTILNALDPKSDVLEKQIPDIDSGQQAILLSIGGNDVELVNILNQCIYQWAVLTEEQVKIAKAAALKGGYDWAAGFEFDHLSRGCQGQLDYAQSLIEGDEFSQNIDKVLTAAKAKLSKDGTIYMTGYGKFFGEELSPECNDVSWSTWLYKAVNLFQPQAMLTADNRRRMNELVDAVNSKLQAAVERAGPSVKFVNYDKYIGQLGGRYCEPGVDESTSESNTRIGLMFYELSTFDFSGSSPWKRSNGDPLNGTFEGSLDVLAQVTLLVDPNADLVHENLVEGKSTAGGIFSEFSSEINKAALDIQVPNLLPDG
ncbi:hypothetical protein FQN50_002444 [Emmonsiellopsis sp. PD_5]|nr:hypothetical protein FQN50_002444 [Emmonsiellopsis sp. PD_5]